MLDNVRLPGVPLTDPAWAEARRGRPSANAGAALRARALSADEIEALVIACDPRSPSGKRNRALLALLWRAGVRNGEAVGRDFRPRVSPKGPQLATRRFPGLFERDLDLTNGFVYITYGKGNRKKPYKPRTVAIDPGGAALIQVWIDERRRLGIPKTVQLFCTISDDAERYGERWRPLSTTYVRNLTKRLGLVAAIDRRSNPHSLRATMATELALEGKPLAYIQQQLGHESAATTARYIADVAPHLLADVMRSRVLPPVLQLPAHDDAA